MTKRRRQVEDREESEEGLMVSITTSDSSSSSSSCIDTPSCSDSESEEAEYTSPHRKRRWSTRRDQQKTSRAIGYKKGTFRRAGQSRAGRERSSKKPSFSSPSPKGAAGGRGDLQTVPEMTVIPGSAEGDKPTQVPSKVLGDMMACYVIFRSFSWQLRLSPFPFKDFCAALSSSTPNYLIDEAHVCLLRALVVDEIQIERDLHTLDLTHLDHLTWPCFVWEMLDLLDDPLAEMKTQMSEYYTLPLEGKTAILLRLCDHLLERHSIRAEIDRREARGEFVSGEGGKGGAFAMMSAEEKRRAEAKAARKQFSDANTDACVLCGVGGNLLCCDGCPAAFHLRCLGYSARSLGQGSWHCPECIVGGRGEMAGLRIPVAARNSCAEPLHLISGMVVRTELPEVEGEGKSALEVSPPFPPTTLYLGEEAEKAVRESRRLTNRTTDETALPSSFESIKDSPFNRWPKRKNDEGNEVSGPESYSNRYKNGWAAYSTALRSVLEDQKRRRGPAWIPSGTCGRLPVFEHPIPMTLSKFQWPQMQGRPFSGGRTTLRCGKCHTCLRPTLRKGCLNPIAIKSPLHDEDSSKALSDDGAADGVDGNESRPGSHASSKLSYLVAYAVKVEREFWPLAGDAWSDDPRSGGGMQFRAQWGAGVRSAASCKDVFEPLCRLVRALRPVAFVEKCRRSWCGVDEPPPDTFLKITQDLVLPTSQSTEMEVLKYNGEHMQEQEQAQAQEEVVEESTDTDLEAWVTQAQSAVTCAELALAIRKLDDALDWEGLIRDKESPWIAASIMGKRHTGRVTCDYLIHHIQGPPKAPQEPGTDQPFISDLSAEQSWFHENQVPLWLVRSYEESLRREAANTAARELQAAAKMAKDSAIKRAADFAVAAAMEVCVACGGSRDGGARSQQDGAADVWICCQGCNGWFHEKCAPWGGRKGGKRGREADSTGRQTCPLCAESARKAERATRRGRKPGPVVVKEKKSLVKGEEIRPTRGKQADVDQGIFKDKKKEKENEKEKEKEEAQRQDRRQRYERRQLGQPASTQEFVSNDGSGHLGIRRAKKRKRDMPWGWRVTFCGCCNVSDQGRPLTCCVKCDRWFHPECSKTTTRCADCCNAQHPGLIKPPRKGTIEAGIRKAREEKDGSGANEWKEAALGVIDKMMRQTCAAAFCVPVTDDIAPGYSSVVHYPLDLSELRRALAQGDVGTPCAVLAGIDLIVRNCEAYNDPSSKIVAQAKAMRVRFLKFWAEANLPGVDAFRGKDPPSWTVDALRSLNKVTAMKEAVHFLEPVPRGFMNYHKLIQEPMDLGIVRNKLKKKEYQDADSFVLDVRLVWKNCLDFNEPGSEVVADAKACQTAFEASWASQTAKWPHVNNKTGTDASRTNDGTGSDSGKWKEAAAKVLYRTINMVAQARWFSSPVSLAEAPDYGEVVPHPMDLGTMSEKLSRGEYAQPSEVWADAELVWANAVKYNGKEHQIARDSVISASAFERYWTAAGLPLPTTVENATDKSTIPNGIAWMRAVNGVLDAVRKSNSSDAGQFEHQVTDDIAPGYSKVVSQPICLKDISKALVKGQYEGPEAVLSDLRLMFSNCFAYNVKNSPVWNAGKSLELEILRQWHDRGLPGLKRAELRRL